ncbi:M1 family aminopeptidase [Algoriphagus sp. Y33]|uniref:ABC transporter permease/M1 family aminopeptidase n=1 Tax=Algoriphagus sp. Y33 TaxID=2772483 RepID=UPI0017804461|nr:M1 family aminopeptidase [Algoriphagus sp. Y33]
MKGSSFFSLLRFELGYQLKTKAVYIFALGYFGFAFLMGSQGATPAGVNYNSEYELFLKMGLISLGAVFSIMFFVVSAVQRDSKFGMEALIFSTPLSKPAFFFSRFLGAWLIGIPVLLIAIPGFHLGIAFSDLDPDRITAFYLRDSIPVAWMLLIPSVTVCTVLLFAICLLTKNSLATYAMAVLIYALYFISALFLNSPLLANATPVTSDDLVIAALADPFGLSAFFEQTNLWTPFQKNRQPISFLSLLGWNRILWMSISGLLLALSYFKFSFRATHQPHGKKKGQSTSARAKSAPNPLSSPIRVDICLNHYRTILLSLLRQNLRFILKSTAFWAVMGTWSVLAITEIYSKIYAGGAYDESYFPASQLLLEQVQQPMYLFGILLLVFFSGELVWRAKSMKFHEILGATPTPNTYFFLSKLLSLISMTVLIIGVTVVIALCFQLAQGYLSMDSLALFSLFAYPGFPLFFYAALFLLIHNFSKSNYLGMGISAIGFALFAGPLGTALGLDHPLLKIGDLPPLNYSQQAGWGMNPVGFRILALLWTFLACSVILFSISNWRGSLHRIAEKFKWNKSIRAGLASFTGFIALACFCFYQINYVEDYQSRQGILDAKQRYELNYKKFEKDAVLNYSALKMNLALFPSRGTYHAVVEGTMKNNSGSPISKMLLTEKQELKKLSLQNAAEIIKEEESGVYQVVFELPILPGEEIGFSFEIQTNPSLFSTNPSIIKDGSYLNFRDFSPYFGYSKAREISDNQERKRRGLPLKPDSFSSPEHELRLEHSLMKVDFEAEISTAFPQIVLTSGDLIDQKTEGNRTIFKYKSAKKMMPVPAFFSGNYHVASLRSGGKLLKVYSLPAHAFASTETLAIMKTSLEMLSGTFGDYPDGELKIVEVPSYWGFGGFAHPGMISMVEDNYFLVKPEPQFQFDLRHKRVIHEVAHQWFGHLLAPRNIPGATLFVEGFAKYAEALVMEKERGKAALWHLTDNANRTYFRGRAFASEAEPPLAKMQSQHYLAYGKSILGLLAIEELIGPEKLKSVIRKMVEENRNNPLPNVHVQDFLGGLKAISSPAEILLIEDWFEKVVHYEIKIKGVTTDLLSSGAFELKIAYSAKKLETRSDGSIQEIVMDEPITLSLLSAHPQEITSGSEIIASRLYTLHSGDGELTVVSKVKPRWIGIDPWGTRPDANRRDNFYRID